MSAFSGSGRSGGDGHFSLVFTAVHKPTNRQVALKFYHPLLRTPDPTHVYRWNSFQREAELLMELARENDIICCLSPISEFIHSVPTGSLLTWSIPFAYYSLELAQCDVTAAIESKKWDPVAKLTAFGSMCRAVQRLHRHNICHRDLKPSNFLVLKDGTVKLADLGAACRIDDKTPHLLSQYSFFPGDRFYSPPEMLGCLHDEEARLAYWSDFYSLGAILFETLCWSCTWIASVRLSILLGLCSVSPHL